MAIVAGRDGELEAVRDLLDGVSAGPAVLVLTGEAGIGKTTVWNAGVDLATSRGFTSLTCQPFASDMRLSYAGLSDLLAGIVLDHFKHLPAPQRAGLDAALLREQIATEPFDPRAVAAGFQSILDDLGRRSRVLLAVDDIQWLDEPSRLVLEYAVRRCRGQVAVLFARRVESGHPVVAGPRPRQPERLKIVPIEPLSQSDLRQLLRRETGVPLARPTFARIAEISGGNPFYALELARSSQDAHPGSVDLPESLQAVIRERISRLDASVREVLQLVAMLASPRVAQVVQAIPDGDILALLGAAEEEGVITLARDGTIRFSHPLLAAGVYAGMSPVRRRDVHRLLSAQVDDPEERARHLALATVGPDPATARALDHAATHARMRGAPGTAAELLEMAINLGASEPSRLVQTAQDHYSAGNPQRARVLLERALSDLEPGDLRARALGQLGLIRFEIDASMDGVALLERSVDEAGLDSGMRSSLRIDLSYVLFINGRVLEALHHIDAAVREARESEEHGLLAEALAGAAITRFLSGSGIDEQALSMSLQLESDERRTPVRRWPSTVAAQLFRWNHRLDEALARFSAVGQRCLDNGLESDLWFVSLGAVPAACWAGRIDAARELVDDTLERARIVETDYALGMAHLFEAQFAAWTGEVERTRRAAALASKHLAAGGASTIVLEIPAAAGMLELSSGNYQAAAEFLVPAARAAIAMQFKEPASAQFLPDAAEVLIALDRHDEAKPIIEMLEASGEQRDRSWAQASGARCRGLLQAATGNLDAAEASYRHAFAAHDHLPQSRYDRGRTFLALAALQRRRNQRRAAHDSIVEAIDLFRQIGAAGWAARASADKERLGLRSSDGGELTPTEEHIARLAASGMINREIAAALSISPKTVEAHLTRIYQKLGIHTRAELGWQMAERVRPPHSA